MALTPSRRAYGAWHMTSPVYFPFFSRSALPQKPQAMPKK
jgi:hypothetical protein